MKKQAIPNERFEMTESPRHQNSNARIQAIEQAKENARLRYGSDLLKEILGLLNDVESAAVAERDRMVKELEAKSKLAHDNGEKEFAQAQRMTTEKGRKLFGKLASHYYGARDAYADSIRIVKGEQ